MSLLNKDTKSILQQYVLIYLKILEVFFRTFGFENFFNIYICVFSSNFVQIENVKSSRWTLHGSPWVQSCACAPGWSADATMQPQEKGAIIIRCRAIPACPPGDSIIACPPPLACHVLHAEKFHHQSTDATVLAPVRMPRVPGHCQSLYPDDLPMAQEKS